MADFYALADLLEEDINDDDTMPIADESTLKAMELSLPDKQTMKSNPSKTFDDQKMEKEIKKLEEAVGANANTTKMTVSLVKMLEITRIAMDKNRSAISPKCNNNLNKKQKISTKYIRQLSFSNKT